MQFNITFDASSRHRYAIETPGSDIGLAELDDLRKTYGPAVHMWSVDDHLDRLDVNPTFDVDEEFARKAGGLFDHKSKVVVHVTAGQLNKFTFAECQTYTSPDERRYRIGRKVDKWALLETWVNEGCPTNWEKTPDGWEDSEEIPADGPNDLGLWYITPSGGKIQKKYRQTGP